MEYGTITLEMHDVADAIENAAQAVFYNDNGSASVVSLVLNELDNRFSSNRMQLAAIYYFGVVSDSFAGEISIQESALECAEAAIWERLFDLYEEAGLEMPEH